VKFLHFRVEEAARVTIYRHRHTDITTQPKTSSEIGLESRIADTSLSRFQEIE
jgi:hypothetical protein